MKPLANLPEWHPYDSQFLIPMHAVNSSPGIPSTSRELAMLPSLCYRAMEPTSPCSGISDGVDRTDGDTFLSPGAGNYGVVSR
jgi:hypothetical protein